MILAAELFEAQLIERVNRYLATVTLNESEVEAFVPNPGRMNELMIPGVSVLIRKAGHSKRKTSHDLVAVYYEDEWICIDSQTPNKFLLELLYQRALEEFAQYPDIRKEVTYMNSRFDFFLDGKGKGCFIEAKSCTLVENGVALFPDAPTKRGTRHVHELISAVEDGYQAYVIIVIQSLKANLFRPNKKTDPDFAEAMTLAIGKGVGIIAIAVSLTGNEIHFNKRVEVSVEP